MKNFTAVVERDPVTGLLVGSDILTCGGIRVNPSGDKSGGVWWWENRFPWR